MTYPSSAHLLLPLNDSVLHNKWTCVPYTYIPPSLSLYKQWESISIRYHIPFKLLKEPLTFPIFIRIYIYIYINFDDSLIVLNLINVGQKVVG